MSLSYNKGHLIYFKPIIFLFLVKIAIVGTFGFLGGCEFGKFAVELLVQKYLQPFLH